jgi:hypothetical protein
MTLINSSFEKFTGEVCAQIKCSEVHTEIKEELMSHLEEMREEYISQGSSSEEAERLAVAHMGDSETIGYDEKFE